MPRWLVITFAVLSAQMLLAWVIGSRLQRVAEDYPGTNTLDRLRPTMQVAEAAAAPEAERKQG